MLMWIVTFPRQDPISILYTNFSDPQRLDVLDMNVTTVLTTSDILESVLVITVLQNVSMNGTLVECRGEDLGSSVVTAYVNTSGMSDLKMTEYVQ